jgi:hypothetical protein
VIDLENRHVVTQPGRRSSPVGDPGAGFFCRNNFHGKKEKRSKKERGGPWKMKPLWKSYKTGFPQWLAKPFGFSTFPTGLAAGLSTLLFRAGFHLKEVLFLSEGWGAPPREIARFTDFYALGCMLYELFNKDLFGALMWRNPQYRNILAAISVDLLTRSPADRVLAWRENARRFRRAVAPPKIDNSGTSVPPAVAGILTDLLHGLVKFDFAERTTDFEWIRNRAVRAIYILGNERMQTRLLVQAKVARQNRLAKLERRRMLAENKGRMRKT